MRTISMKSVCVLVGFLVPCCGLTARSEAGVIPWIYDSIFGYGWGGSSYGGGHGGYGGGMPYSAGYGGWGYGGGYGSSYAPAYSYSGLSYGMPASGSSCCGTASYALPSTGTGCCGTPTYAAPASPVPVISTPATTVPNSPPTDGQYNLRYGPSLGDYDSGYGYYTGYGPTYAGDQGSCCVPSPACCSTGGSATSVESAKPAPNPTPVNKVTPVTPKTPPVDGFREHRGGTGGVRSNEVEETLPSTERGPTRRPEEAGPANGETPPAGEVESIQFSPTEGNVAVRYVPTMKRTKIAVPTSVARVVRLDRAAREQLVRAEAKPKLAANR